MTEAIQLLVVDDHTLFRRGLIALLSQDERFHIVGEAGDVGEAFRVLSKVQPDLMLLDNHLPGVKGVDAIVAFKDACPDLRILMLTVSEDEEDLSKALQNGADGYLLKTAETEQLCDALVQVHDGHSVISPAMLNKLVTGLRQSPGTPAASSNKQIARDLDIAETTVKIHIQHIFKKMNLTSRVQIAIFAAGNGLS